MNAAKQSPWDFAVALYGRPGVRDACLALQDRRGADVVALMALLHAVAAGGSVPPEPRLRLALALVEPWRSQAVLPLRTIRRTLKGWRFDGADVDKPAESARQAVAAAELAAERVELETLSAALASDVAASPGAQAAGGAAALSLYWRVAGLGVDARDRGNLAVLLGAAFPDSAADAAGGLDGAFGA